MKSTFLALAAMAVFFTLFYLMGCFAENSFNIGNWEYGARIAVGVFGGVVSIGLGMISAGAYEQNNQ